MTDITVTPPSVITVTATSPNSYTIAVTQPAPITVTASLGSTGDMTKAVYDTDNDGIVDNSESLGGIAASGFVQTGNASWVDLTDGGSTTLHSHAGSSGTVTSIATTAPITGGTITSTGTIGIDAATTLSAGSMSASDKTKLDGIESNAEQNNISDVNATDLTDGGVTALHSHATDHARQHSITSTSDHTSSATVGQLLKADANGLPVNAVVSDAEVSAAVTASHAAVTVVDSTSIDLTLTGQQISAAAIFGTGAGVVAEGNHTHSYQPLDSDLTAIAAIAPTDDDVIQRKAGAWINRTIAQLVTDIRAVIDLVFAPIAKGVTNGDTHDHNGGDGAQIAHGNLSDVGTNTHATIDTHIAAVNPHSGSQPLDTELTAIAGLTSAADKGIQFTGIGTAATYDLTAAGKALLDDADASTQRSTLGLAIGTNVQAQDAELSAIAGLTSAADSLPYFTGSGTASLATFTAAGRALVDDADAAAQRATLSVPANVGTSVANNFVSFSNTTGAQQDSGKGLTHLVYTLQTAGVAAVNPADGSTYYVGGENSMTTGANIRSIYFPFAGTIVYASVVILVNTILGDATNFSCYIRINNTTDITITSTAVATAAKQQFSNTGLSTAVSVNDYFEGKIVFPTWPTTNPTGVKAYFTVGVRV